MRIFTLPLLAGLRYWERLQNYWPVECQRAWLGAEYGRITSRHYITIAEADAGPVAAATWMELNGDEQRRGYSVYDVLLGWDLEVTLSATAPLPSGLDRRVQRLRSEIDPGSLLPSVAVVIPGCTLPGVVWDRSLSAEIAQDALSRLIDALLAAASAAGQRSVGFLHVPLHPLWEPLRVALSQAGLLPAWQSPTTVIPIPSDGLDGFLASLSAKWRSSIRREMRVFAESIDAVHPSGPDRLMKPDILDLQFGRYSKYGLPTNRAEVYDRMERAQNLPNVVVFVAERQGEAVGFNAVVLDEAHKRIVSRFGGWGDGSFNSYYNLVYYKPIEYGSATGLTSLVLGTETYRAKLDRGASLVPLQAFTQVVGGSAGYLRSASQLRSEVEEYRMECEKAPSLHEEGRYY